ncbi:MAG: endonuclease V [Nanoarchaeota archaeon]
MKLDLDKLKEIQKELAKQINLDSKIKEIKIITGFDVAYTRDKLICASASLDFNSLALIEKKYLITDIKFPYISGFLAFREGQPIIELFEKIEKKPDIIMVNGHGIAHELKCGLATYVGVTLKVPTIGIATRLHVGIIKEGKIIVSNEHRGYELSSKEKAKPLYISPGNLISPEDAFEIAKKCIRHPHKLPEPLHIAHRLATKKKKKLFPTDKVEEEA